MLLKFRSDHRGRFAKYPLRRASWVDWDSYALGWNLLGSPLQNNSLLTGLNSEAQPSLKMLVSGMYLAGKF